MARVNMQPFFIGKVNKNVGSLIGEEEALCPPQWKCPYDAERDLTSQSFQVTGHPVHVTSQHVHCNGFLILWVIL
jgi:hypothetical protein